MKNDADAKKSPHTSRRIATLRETSPDVFKIEPPLALWANDLTITHITCCDRYVDDTMAVLLYNESYEEVARLNTNLPESKCLPQGCFYLKDWGENRNLALILIDLGLVELVPDEPAVQTGFCTAKVARLARPAHVPAGTTAEPNPSA